MEETKHRELMISWPTLIPGECWSAAGFGAWRTPEQLIAMGYFPWVVLHPSGQPWALGLAAPGPAIEVLRSFDGRVSADALPRLEERLRQVLGGHGWRQERFGLIGPQGMRAQLPALSLERSLFRTLGLMSESVQLNLQAAPGVWWAGRRAQSKAVDPGLLDACVAGGLTAMESPILALFREAQEEAGLPTKVLARAHFLGAVRVFRVLPAGLLIERVWTYGLDAPIGFEPRPCDGEVDVFMHQTIADIQASWSAGGFNHEAAVATLSFAVPAPTR
ncbi:MAG: NUDIX domain-containing protein [Burkholderiaceae bacterium]